MPTRLLVLMTLTALIGGAIAVTARDANGSDIQTITWKNEPDIEVRVLRNDNGSATVEFVSKITYSQPLGREADITVRKEKGTRNISITGGPGMRNQTQELFHFDPFRKLGITR